MGADSLTEYGVEVRYPDEFYMPTRAEAEQSVQIALRVRDMLRQKLAEFGSSTP